MAETLISLPEIAVVVGKRVEDVEAEVHELGLPVTRNWRGQPCLSAEQAKRFVNGEPQHEKRLREFQAAERHWLKNRESAVSAAIHAATKNRLGYYDAGSMATAQAVAAKTTREFEKRNPRPTFGDIPAKGVPVS
jgi:hypothetical protein